MNTRFHNWQERFTQRFTETYTAPDSESVAELAWQALWDSRSPEKKKDPAREILRLRGKRY